MPMEVPTSIAKPTCVSVSVCVSVCVCVYCVREADLTSVYTVYSVFGFPGNYKSVMASYEARLLRRIWTQFGLC